jgi:hypothetical protein
MDANKKVEAAMKLAKAYLELEEIAVEKNKAQAQYEEKKERIRSEIRRLSEAIKEGITP